MTLYERLPLNTRKACFNDLFFEVDERVYLRPEIEYFEQRGDAFARFNTKYTVNDGYAALKAAVENGHVYVYPAPEDSL